MFHRIKRKPNRNVNPCPRSGATAVEFACVAPVFIFVIAVCADFARLSMMRNLAQNAAYEAARFVMAEGATVNDGINRANQILARLGTKNAIVRINGSDGSTGANGQVINEIDSKTAEITCHIEIPLAANSAILPASMMGGNIVATSLAVRTERFNGYYDGQSVN
jgi:Flp pilus assembly protein TadG